MNELIEKAAVLIEALPYIQRFQGETVVVKFGGSIMDDRDGVNRILRDVAFMHVVGLCPVIVHGGGKAISRRMEERGLEPVFVNGLRVTDTQSIGVVEEVLNTEVNPGVVATLESFECKARGLCGEDLLRVVKHTQTDPDSGEITDWGFVGEVSDVDVEPIHVVIGADIVPVITPLGRGPDNRIYNVNADEAAAAIARGLKARKLVFLSDVPGLLRDANDSASLITHVERDRVQALIKKGVIDGGMRPKIAGALKALGAGVRKTHIIDSSIPHSLLLELFTDKGVGTEIVH